MPKLTPDPQNARLHPERNKALIRQSLEEVGAGRSILVDGDGIVRAGNGVYEQAQALGLKVRQVEAQPDELIAVVRPDLRGDAAIRAAILDNATGETSTWDMEALRQLQVDMPDLLAGLDELQAEFDAALDAELPEPPPEQAIIEQWAIVVTCASESEQTMLFAELTERGITCRLLVS